MKERPILFSGPMVRAILAESKTQTRRAIKNPNDGVTTITDAEGAWICVEGWEWEKLPCPYGQPGDRLWVREAHGIHNAHGQHRDDGKRWGPWGGLPTTVSPDGALIAYYREGFDRCDPSRWSPSIHMPRWACRIVLEITDVRVQRLQEISEEDARAEGIRRISHGREGDFYHFERSEPHPKNWVDPRDAFRHLWNSINAARGYGWDANPWVWAISFKRVEA